MKRKDVEITDDIMLKDYLAISRSNLANERTLLAFVRTGMMFFVSSLSLIKLFPTKIFLFSLGYLFLPVSVVLLIWGILRFRQTANAINKIQRRDVVPKMDK